MKNDDRTVAAQLFGVVRPRAAPGGFTPSADELRHARDNDEDCAMPVFCDGCGSVRRMTERGVQGIALKLGVSVPEPVKDYFLRLDRCPQCGAGANLVRFVPFAEITAG